MRRLSIAVAVAVLAIVCFLAPIASAEDLILNVKVDSVTTAVDKNGNEYVRVIIVENRTLKGVAYSATVPVMFFGQDLSEQAKQIQKGQQIKVLVNKRIYQGNPSYTARQLLPS